LEGPCRRGFLQCCLSFLESVLVQSNLDLTLGGPNFRGEVAWRKRLSCLLLLNDFKMVKDMEDIVWGLAVNACSSAVTTIRRAMYLLQKKTPNTIGWFFAIILEGITYFILCLSFNRHSQRTGVFHYELNFLSPMYIHMVLSLIPSRIRSSVSACCCDSFVLICWRVLLGMGHLCPWTCV